MSCLFCMTKSQSPKMLFNCEFCNYQSNLNLRECPNCGKVNNKNTETTGLSNFEAEKQQNLTSKNQSSQFNSSKKMPSKKLIYTCQKCRYQTPNALPECPECGNRNFSQTEVSIKSAGKQNEVIKVDMERVGKICQGFGIGFFGIALLVFWGVGPTGKSYPRSGIIANPGENWIGAFILVVVGLILILLGTYLKNK